MKFKERNTIFASLNSFEENGNPSQIIGNFIVHDFKQSWNGAIITKEVAKENMHYLVGQYICCKYYSKEENQGEDALGSHEATTCINRDTGEEMETTNTTPIGTITEVCISQNSEGEEVLCCKAILWLDKFYNCLSFLNEMIQNGIEIPCSVEYGYKNFYMKDGVRYDQSPIYYNALCILNPVDRGKIKAVAPAYDCSKFTGYSFNEKIEQDLQNQKKDGEQMDNIFVKALNATLGDKRDAIMQALSDTLTATEFNSAWISMYGIDDDANTITYETYSEGEWKTYQISFSLNEEGVYVIDLDSKQELEYEVKLVAKNSINEMETSINELTSNNETLVAEKETLETSLNEANDKVAELECKLSTFGEDKVDLVEQVTSLNARIAELEPYKEKVEEMEAEAKFQTALNSYSEKFDKYGAKEECEKQEVQDLIRETLSDEIETSLNAKLAIAERINEIAMDSIASKTSTTVVKEVCGKKVTNLLPSKKVNSDHFGFEVE